MTSGDFARFLILFLFICEFGEAQSSTRFSDIMTLKPVETTGQLRGKSPGPFGLRSGVENRRRAGSTAMLEAAITTGLDAIFYGRTFHDESDTIGLVDDPREARLSLPIDATTDEEYNELSMMALALLGNGGGNNLGPHRRLIMSLVERLRSASATEAGDPTGLRGALSVRAAATCALVEDLGHSHGVRNKSATIKSVARLLQSQDPRTRRWADWRTTFWAVSALRAAHMIELGFKDDFRATIDALAEADGVAESRTTSLPISESRPLNAVDAEGRRLLARHCSLLRADHFGGVVEMTWSPPRVVEDADGLATIDERTLMAAMISRQYGKKRWSEWLELNGEAVIRVATSGVAARGDKGAGTASRPPRDVRQVALAILTLQSAYRFIARK